MDLPDWYTDEEAWKKAMEVREMTEIPEEYLVTEETMNPAQRSRYRRTQLAGAIHRLIYNEFYDLSNSEIQAVCVGILNRSIHRNMRPKRRIIGQSKEEE